MEKSNISLQECIDWCERYGDIQFTHLALYTATNKDHSPLEIMYALLQIARDQDERLHKLMELEH